MNGQSETNSCELTFELGTFEGFNFHTQSAIPRLLTAEQVLSWNYDREGEAEFWPSGDKPEVSLVFNRKEITASELSDLDRLLTELGDDSKENYLRIHYKRVLRKGLAWNVDSLGNSRFYRSAF